MHALLYLYAGWKRTLLQKWQPKSEHRIVPKIIVLYLLLLFIHTQPRDTCKARRGTSNTLKRKQ